MYKCLRPVPKQMQRHGQKIYIQVLLDPNRADLLRQHAEATGQTFSSCARGLIYEQLKRLDPGMYAEADRRDDEEREQRQELMRQARIKKRNEPLSAQAKPGQP